MSSALPSAAAPSVYSTPAIEIELKRSSVASSIKVRVGLQSSQGLECWTCAHDGGAMSAPCPCACLPKVRPLCGETSIAPRKAFAASLMGMSRAITTGTRQRMRARFRPCLRELLRVLRRMTSLSDRLARVLQLALLLNTYMIYVPRTSSNRQEPTNKAILPECPNLAGQSANSTCCLNYSFFLAFSCAALAPGRDAGSNPALPSLSLWFSKYFLWSSHAIVPLHTQVCSTRVWDRLA